MGAGEARRGGVKETTYLSGGATNCRMFAGSGDPEGAIVGNVGDFYTRCEGSPSQCAYVKAVGNGTNVGWEALGTTGRIYPLFITCVANTVSTIGTHIGNQVGVNGSANLEFWIPGNVTQIMYGSVCAIPGGTNPAADVDMFSEYGTPMEPYDQHAQSSTDRTFDMTTDVIITMDALPVMTGAGPGDHVGIQLVNNGVTGGYLIMGMLIAFTVS